MLFTDKGCGFQFHYFFKLRQQLLLQTIKFPSLLSCLSVYLWLYNCGRNQIRKKWPLTMCLYKSHPPSLEWSCLFQLLGYSENIFFWIEKFCNYYANNPLLVSFTCSSLVGDRYIGRFILIDEHSKIIMICWCVTVLITGCSSDFYSEFYLFDILKMMNILGSFIRQIISIILYKICLYRL